MSEEKSAPGGETGAVRERYARWLDWGTRLGLVVLLLSFAAYALGVAPAAVPPEQLPQLWSQPLAQYLAQSGAPTGWAWVAALPRGDALALLGIVMLAGCSVPCLLALVPLAWQRGERRFAWLCVAVAVVVAVAASGLIGGGHG